MRDRIFMDVPQVFDLAEGLGRYSERQNDKLEQYRSAVMQMLSDMEGRAKNGIETASNHINLESQDAVGRMIAFQKIYKFTAKNRLIIDEEAAKAAEDEQLGVIRGKRTGVAENFASTMAESLMTGASNGLESAKDAIDEMAPVELSDEVKDALSFAEDMEIDTAEYL